MAWDNPEFTHLPVTIRRWKGFKREIIDIRRDTITVTEVGVFSKKRWVEPVSAYEGVLLESKIGVKYWGDDDAETPTKVYPWEERPSWDDKVELSVIHRVILVHSDQDKTLLVFEAVDQRSDEELREIRKTWMDAVHALGLPALERSDPESRP